MTADSPDGTSLFFEAEPMEGSMMSLTTVIKAAQDQIACDLSEETVVLSLRSGEYFGLNAVAASVWELIQTPRTVAEITNALLNRFEGVTAEACAREVLDLLTELKRLELVEVS